MESQSEATQMVSALKLLVIVNGNLVSPVTSASAGAEGNAAHSISVANSKDQASIASYADDVMFSFFSSQSNAPQLDNEDLEQIDSDDLEEMDLKWQVAMLTIRVKRFIKKIGKKLDLNGKEIVGFDMTKVKCYNYHRRGHFARECREPRNQRNRNIDASKRNAPVDTSTTNAMYDQQRKALNKSNLEIIGYQMGLESLDARIVVHEKNEAVYEEDIAFLKYDVQVKDISIKEIKNQLENALKEKDDLKLKLEMFETSSKNLTKLINSQISAIDKTSLGYDGQMNESDLNDLHVYESEVLNNVVDSHESDGDDNQVNDRFKKGEGYHAVSFPYTRNYMPPRADLSFTGLDNSVFKSKVSETITIVPKIETNASKTSKDSLEKPKTIRPSAPLIEEWESDSEDKNVFKPKEFGSQRTVNVAMAKENVGSPVVQQSGIQCFNCKEFSHFAKEYRKPKRVKDFTYHKEKMFLWKQAEKGVPLQAEQYDWLADTDEETNEQELEAHYSYMAKIQEIPTADSGTDSEPLEQVQFTDEYNVFANVIKHCEQSESTSNTCLVEKDDRNVTPDLPYTCEHDIQTDQNAKDERAALANLIENLKFNVDENKKIQKQLKKANTSFAHELEQCKSILA
nr:hypothetical protein [Tanacetum cinerariifolium]